MNKIGDTNGFRAMATLRKAALDPRVLEIEGGGMDDGRVFIHLIEGYCFDFDYGGGPIGNRPLNLHSESVGSAADVRSALSRIVKEI